MPSDLEVPRKTTEQRIADIEESRHRLELSQHWLARWDMDVNGRREDAWRAGESAAAFAQMGLRSTLLLNGGALVAFPAFGELIGDVDLTSLKIASTLLVLGLMTGMLGILCAFINREIASKRLFLLAEKNSAILKNEDIQGEQRIKINKNLSDLRSKIDAAVRNQKKWRNAGVALSLLSISFFFFGALNGADMLRQSKRSAENSATMQPVETSPQATFPHQHPSPTYSRYGPFWRPHY